MIETVVGWGPAALWAAVLFLLSAWSSPSVGLATGMDKVVHAGAYLVLGLALAWGRFWTASKVPVSTLVLAGVIYGVLVESYQVLVPGREAEVMDGFANALGVLVGYFAFRKIVPGPWKRDRASEQGTTTSSMAET
jgi:VanZ family protein